MASGGTISKLRYVVPATAPAHLKCAAKYMGTHEWVMEDGSKVSNPPVQKWIERSGGGADADTIDTPWCAYFHDAMLLESGQAAIKSGSARAHLKWGTDVGLDDSRWKIGDSLIFRRLDRDGKDRGKGHITFLVKWNETTVWGLGGNQGDRVCIEEYPRRNLLGVRRPRSIMQSQTVQKAAGSALAETTSQVIDKAVPNWQTHVDTAASVAQDIQGPLEIMSQYKPWIVGVLSALAIALALWAAYHRIVDHNEGYNT